MHFNTATADFEAITEIGHEFICQDICPDDKEDTYPWTVFMKKLDTIIFVCFFALFSLFTTTFFDLLLKRANKTSLEKF